VSYERFLDSKAQLADAGGFEPLWMPEFLFDFQRHLVEWAIRKGRAAIWADCGLGKTPMQLVWAENVVRRTNRPVLILTPLAVASQTCREGEKFGIECTREHGGTKARIVVSNYEQLHHFQPGDFAGVVCDESSCLKAMDGQRRADVTEFMRALSYRLLCTATAAPNDYVELGTSSEAIGEMGQRDMITRFFKQETSKDYLGWGRTKYRLKGHASTPFWRWICSWARACRRPSDLGFSDNGFELPPCVEAEHVVQSRTLPEGFLFELPAGDMQEEREERRRTIAERCEFVASRVAGTGEPAVVWCHLNDEADLLEKLIADGKQIQGSDSVEEKEETFDAFGAGKLRVVIIKPKIGAWGLNWQHCNHVVTFASHSYEQYYQAIRRCWRFGQKRQVNVDIVVTEGERRAAENLARKSEAADKMFSELVLHMNDALAIRKQNGYLNAVETPKWL